LDAEWRTGEQEGGERNYGGLYARIRPRKGFRKKLRAWFALFSILFFCFQLYLCILLNKQNDDDDVLFNWGGLLFIAIGLQLRKIFKITRISFLGL